MRTALKWTGIVIGGLVGLLLVFYAWAAISFALDARRTYDVAPIALPKGSTARGRHLVTVRHMCTECHGDDLSGKVLAENLALGAFGGSNLTPAVLRDWSEGEIARAIRFGVGRDGRFLIGMPSKDLVRVSARDIADMVAYIRSVPAVDRPRGGFRAGPAVKVLVSLGVVPDMKIPKTIDGTVPFPPKVPEKLSVEFGRYLANTCTGCHKPDFTGGRHPLEPPEYATAANLTQDALGDWTEEGFIRTLRSGVNPHGTTLRMPMSNVVMQYTSQYTDTELKALWMFLKTVKGKGGPAI